MLPPKSYLLKHHSLQLFHIYSLQNTTLIHKDTFIDASNVLPSLYSSLYDGITILTSTSEVFL
jgi:hypothetical protein